MIKRYRVTEPEPPTPADPLDSAGDLLDGLDEADVADHVTRYDALHARLRSALATIDRD